MMNDEIGKLLMLAGAGIFVVGLLVLAASHTGWFGRLPGDFRLDFHFRQGNLSCAFPIATSILLSIILTVILNVIIRLFNR